MIRPFLPWILTTTFAALVATVFAAAAAAQNLVRAPYLQMGSHQSATVCWRVGSAAPVRLHYGTSPGSLSPAPEQPGPGTDACATVGGLTPATQYWYALYNGDARLAGGPDHWFRTHPAPGTKARAVVWVLGDAGTGYADQARTRDAFYKLNGPHADAVLFLGDNAYQDGTDSQVTRNTFAPYQATNRNSFSWSTIGNHDAYSEAKEAPYLAAWHHPTRGESGGVPSGSELYYSFDHGDIHFICLDSQRSDRTKAGAMYRWLQADLAAARADWIIAFFHHGPYSFGSHHSDLEEKHPEMRMNFVPLLEQAGVDLVLSGHSHSYERSFLIDGAYGKSEDNAADLARIVRDGKSGDPTTPDGPYRKRDPRAGNQGTVYVVTGSASQLEEKEAEGKHPVMHVEHMVMGTTMLVIEGDALSGFFIDIDGAIRDRFQIVQGDGPLRAAAAPPRLAGPLFRKTGRTLAFAAAARGGVFRLWDTRGNLVYSAPVGAELTLSPALPAGLYHYRAGTRAGTLLLE